MTSRGLLLVLIVVSVSFACLVAPTASAGPTTAPASDAGPAPASFSMNGRVNTGGLGFDYEVEPTMAVDSRGRIFVGWKEAFTHDGGGYRVAFSYSLDRGDTWAPNVLMPLALLQRQSDPWLTVTPDDRVFFSRLEVTGSLSEGGLVVSNTTDGVNWGTSHFLDDRPNFADKQSHANDAAGNVYMIWNSDSFNYELVFSRSLDGGATWSPKVRVADSPTGSLGGIIQVHPNGTLLATWWSWLSNDILFDRSFDGGATWGPDVRINGVPGSARDAGQWQIPIPAMNVDPASGRVVIAWPDSRGGNQDIYVAVSDDGGETWAYETRVDDDTGTQIQYMVDLTIDPFGGIHAAWEDRRNGAWDIVYSNSTDGGRTWGDELVVTTASTPATYDRPGDYFALESGPDGTIYAVWTDGRGADLDIYFSRLERTFRYTVDTVPSGLALEVDGATLTAPRSFVWRVGSTHTVFAPSPQSAGPQTRRTFGSWSDGGGQSHSVVVGEGGGSVTASFDTDHQITVRTQPGGLEVLVGGASVIGTATQWWREGSVHDLAAVSPQSPSAGTRYVFDGWADGETSETRSVTVTAPASYEVRYRLQFLLTVVSPRGNPVGGGWYDANAVAPFSVEATIPGPTGTRYEFAAWSGGSGDTSPSSSVVLDGPKTVTANWRTEHLLAITSPYGTPIGAGWYGEGTVATVSVEETVTVGGVTYRFSGWTGDASDPSNLVLVPMDGPRSLTATWEVVTPGGPTGASVDPLPWVVLGVLLAVISALILFVAWRRRRKEDEGRRPPG